ncbi:hypothetical protein M9979_12180 [Sphingomonas sp. RP10(2022)]|uniref:C-type lysozyme inhibitor domain-containing protein n=1 Tax=Sphingomonas liriopis TaxID=2949094 RepID=A0A9X2HQK0_9SPHN|nr:hypothetical protein [Sphingomonas liriopis]MCP3735631.1 hypothetical protein [Sphingomonas liriopis]
MKKLMLVLGLAVLAAPVAAQTLADGSGTIAQAGVAQQVFGYQPTRRYLVCQNPIAATEPLMVNVGSAAGAANGSIELAPGGSWSLGPSTTWAPTEAVSVYAATAGHRFVCKQG